MPDEELERVDVDPSRVRRPEPRPASSNVGWLHAIRVVAALVTIAALAVILVSAIQTIEDARGSFDVSAVQLIQVYAEHVFCAVVAIGFLVGVYVMTRMSP